MRPGGPLMPNMFVPMVQPGQQGPRPGGRRGNAGPMQQGPQPVPVMQQQVCVWHFDPCLPFFFNFKRICVLKYSFYADGS